MTWYRSRLSRITPCEPKVVMVQYLSSTLTVSWGQRTFCPFMVLLFYRKISTSRIPLIYSVHISLTPILTTIAMSFYNNKRMLSYLFILLSRTCILIRPCKACGYLLTCGTGEKAWKVPQSLKDFCRFADGVLNGMVYIIEIAVMNSTHLLTFRAAVAAARHSSRAFSFCLRFLRKISGTSMSYTI